MVPIAVCANDLYFFFSIELFLIRINNARVLTETGLFLLYVTLKLLHKQIIYTI